MGIVKGEFSKARFLLVINCPAIPGKISVKEPKSLKK